MLVIKSHCNNPDDVVEIQDEAGNVLCVVEVIGTDRGYARIGFTATQEIRILRRSLIEKMRKNQEENKK